MVQKIVTLGVPAEPAYARVVRMTAATLAVGCDMSVEDVEDVRMIAEEGFVYCCATAPEAAEVRFALSEGRVAMEFSLGAAAPQDDSVDLVRVLLAAVCDEFAFVGEDGRTLRLARAAGGTHDE